MAILGTSKSWIPFSKFRSTGVVNIFRDQDHATKSLLKEIGQSQILHLLAMKGDSFSHPDKPLSKVLSNTGIQQRYLISTLENPYLEKRARELNMAMRESVAFSASNYRIAQNKNNNIRVGRHNVVVRFRLVLLSDSLYLSFQEVNIPGKQSTILKIRSDSPMYKCFYSLFDDLWEIYGQDCPK